jgi:hypothetical protein
MGTLPHEQDGALDSADTIASSGNKRNFLNEYDPDRSTISQAVTNIPSSAKQLGYDMIQPIMHPIQTAKSLKDLGSSIINLFVPGEQGNEQLAKEVGNYFKERYGGLDNIKQTFATDPVALLSDVSIILSGGAMIAPKGSALAGTLSKASKIEPITAATKAVSIPSGFIAKNTIAKLQGTSGDAIGAGFAAGQKGGESSAAFSRAISGTDDPIKIAEDANEAFNKMKKDKQVEFMNAKDRLKLDKTKIDVNKVQTEILDLIDTKYFNSFTDLSKNSEKILNNIIDEIAIWQKNPALHNAKGLDMLKRKIGDMYPLNPKSRGEQAIVIEMQNIIKNQIINQVPKYGKVMEAYETASKLERQLMQQLSLGNKNASTTLKKLQSVLRNNVNTNFGARLHSFKNIKNIDDINLTERIAGTSLSSWTPTNIAGQTTPIMAGLTIANPVTAAILPFMSPRLTGKAAQYFGKGSHAVKPALQTLRINEASGNRINSGLLGQQQEDRNKGLL